MAQERDWSERIQYAILRDNLGGRRWETTIDTTPGAGPCAPINTRGWVDPLDTPQGVLTHALKKDEDGRLMLDLREAYETWRDSLKQKRDAYEQLLLDNALRMFGERGPDAYEERAPALLQFTGPAPQAWEPIEAALQGNSAALGLKPLTSDPRIAKYFVKPEPVKLSFKDEDLDALEEQHDPDAKGGKRVPIKTGGKRLAEEAA